MGQLRQPLGVATAELLRRTQTKFFDLQFHPFLDTSYSSSINGHLKIVPGELLTLDLTEAMVQFESLEDSQGLLRSIRGRDVSLSFNQLVYNCILPVLETILNEDKRLYKRLSIIIGEHMEKSVNLGAELNKKWIIQPNVISPIRNERYVLIHNKKTDDFYVKWGQKSTPYEFLNSYNAEELLGSGGINVLPNLIALFRLGESFQYPGLDLVHDAGSAIAQALFGVIPLKTLVIEGEVKCDFSLKR